MTEGVTPVSKEIFHLHMLIFWICVGIGVVTFGVMFYAIIYHRKSRGAVAANFHDSLTVEIIWTIIPFLILVGMAIPATKVLLFMDNTDDSELTVKITGYMWKWEYEYLGTGVRYFSNLTTTFDQIHNRDTKDPNYLLEVDNRLILPTNRKIRFITTANDVIHSWFVPKLGVKKDAIPGFTNETWAIIEQSGVYRGQCTELCGVNHGFMPIVVEAVSPEEFDTWLQAKISPPPVVEEVINPETGSVEAVVAEVKIPDPPTKTISMEELIVLGEKVYAQNCSVCHQTSGAGMPPGIPAITNSKVVNGNLIDHINLILNGKEGTAMQAFDDRLTDEEIAAVITYQRNRLGNSVGDEAQPIDVYNLRYKVEGNNG